MKSYVELRLQPREDKYYLIEIVNDPRGLTRFEQSRRRHRQPERPAALPRGPHDHDQRLPLLAAVRPALRARSPAGSASRSRPAASGSICSLFEDRFELRQDLFGFGEVVLPRWRISLGYEFIQRLWLLGGVDDIFSPMRRDYFVGLQLKFNDEDLKTILPFAPSP